MVSDPAPTQRVASKVGKLQADQTLDSLEVSLSMPQETRADPLLDQLQHSLQHSARKLQVPRLSDAEEAQVEQAQLASSAPKEQVLACDGVMIDNIPVDRNSFARLRTSRHLREQGLESTALYLNDEVINAWSACVKRSGFDIHIFTTLFVASLWTYGGKANKG